MQLNQKATQLRSKPTVVAACPRSMRVLLAVAAGAAFWFALAQPAAQPMKTGLVAQESSLHLGTVWAQDRFQWAVLLKNPTDDDITVVGVTASCGCASVAPAGLTIPAGATRPLELSLDLWRILGSDSRPLRPFDLNLHVTAERRGAQATEKWALDGTIQSSISAPRTLIFGGADRPCTESPSPAMSAAVTSHIDLRDLSAACDANFATVCVHRDKKEPRKFTLSLALAPSLAVGPFAFDLRLQPEAQNRSPVPSFAIRVKGVVESDLFSVPEVLSPPRQSVDSAEPLTIILQSRSEKRFKVERVASTGVFSASRVLELAGESGEYAQRRAFTVYASPAGTGTDCGELAFFCATENGKTQVIRVPSIMECP